MMKLLNWQNKLLPSKTITNAQWILNGQKMELPATLYIVQARPETVKSQEKHSQTIERYNISRQGNGFVKVAVSDKNWLGNCESH